jgi:hypothetical protein
MAYQYTLNALKDLAEVDSLSRILSQRFSLAPVVNRTSLPLATVAAATTCLVNLRDFWRNSNAT